MTKKAKPLPGGCKPGSGEGGNKPKHLPPKPLRSPGQESPALADAARPVTKSGQGWRNRFKVHPAADVFPMMSDEELAVLGENIKKNGLTSPVVFWLDPNGKGENNPDTNLDGSNRFLLDGRNRLEAMERVGLDDLDYFDDIVVTGDPVAYVISANIHRRHLTKQQQAELIVAAVKAGEKPHQPDAVSKGGRGKVNPVKSKAVKIAADAGISKPTVERAIAKSEGKKPATAPRPTRPKQRPEPLNSLAWSEAPPELRTKWIDAVGIKSIWQAMSRQQREQLYQIALVDQARADEAAA